MERIDVVDCYGTPTGETVERDKAHKEGIMHRTSHVWIVRKKEEHLEILLQKRCRNKDSFPGCYDISSAGHIPAGGDYILSALRELKEELGIDALPEELIDCGFHRKQIDTVFHGERFVDNQISKVFLLWKDREEEEFLLQPEEIESVCWMEYNACKQAIRDNSITHCIDIEELKLLEEYL